MESLPPILFAAQPSTRDFIQLLFFYLTPMLALSVLHVLYFPQWQMGAFLICAGLLSIPPLTQSVFRMQKPFFYALFPSLLIGQFMVPAFFMAATPPAEMAVLMWAGFLLLAGLVCHKSWIMEKKKRS